MKPLYRIPFLLAAALGAMLPHGAARAAPMRLADYLALRGPAPDAHINYGRAPSQFVELFRPDGPGPFPVLVVLHGGCWNSAFGGIGQMHNVAGALRAQGIAVWNVEYRRVDEEGGGYPGTYQDVNAALARLEQDAPAYGLDLGHLAALGHSAGGQLAQWLAGRARIAPTSALYQAQFLPVRQIISLGGLADLHNEAALIASSCERTTAQLAGRADRLRPDIFSDSNAAELIPNGSTTVLITGELDSISPPRAALAYAARARAAGDLAHTIILPGASHYDEIAATSRSWPLVLAAIRRALNMTPR